MLKSYFVFAFVLAHATALMYMQKTPVSRRVPVSVSATTKQELKDIDKKIFIFGLGYVGTALALKLKSLGWKVAGTTTNVNKVKILREQGLQTFLFDDTTSASLQKDAVEDIMSSRYILSTIPPASTKGDDCVLSAFGDEIRRAAINNDLRWIGYLSSTGVYGDRQGSWVSEEDIPQPSNERTKARALAESRWTTLYERNGIPVHLFRLAGIYGTGRSALDTVRKAKGSIDQCGADDLKFVSRIHVDDIVSIVLASMLFPSPGEVYNVADDLPSTRYDVST